MNYRFFKLSRKVFLGLSLAVICGGFFSCHDRYDLDEEGNYPSWLGESVYEDGVRVFRTLKDKDFLKDWGYNGKPQRQSTAYLNAQNWLLEYRGRRQNVIRLCYCEEDGAILCEVFLNQKRESLFWRRYTRESLKEKLSGQKTIEKGVSYDLDYCCLTSRLQAA